MRGWSWPSPPCFSCPLAAGAQQAWAKAYEDGVEAVREGRQRRPRRAEADRGTRERGPPKQSRRANFSSVVYRAVHPRLLPRRDLRANQGRHKLGAGVPGARAPRGAGQARTTRRTSPWPQQPRSGRARSRRGWPRNTRGRPAARGRRSRRCTDDAAGEHDADADQHRHPDAVEQHRHRRRRRRRSGRRRTRRPTPSRRGSPASGGRWRTPRAALRQSRYTEARSIAWRPRACVAGDAARQREAEALRRDIDAAQNIEAQRIADRARAAIRLQGRRRRVDPGRQARDAGARTRGAARAAQRRRAAARRTAGRRRAGQRRAARREAVPVGQLQGVGRPARARRRHGRQVAAHLPVPGQQPRRPGAARAAERAAGARRRRRASTTRWPSRRRAR